MLLFVDETENEDYFIVTGLLVDSKEAASQAFKQFKKSVKNMPIPSREKTVLFTEFKSVLLDRKHKRIKLKMLEEINAINHAVIFSSYIKKGVYFTQTFKEETYITLLSKIVSSIEADISVIFDTFNKVDFQERILNRIASYENVQAIMPRDSQLEPGLQFVDNLCSVIRLHKSGKDEYDFYSQIENSVIEV